MNYKRRRLQIMLLCVFFLVGINIATPASAATVSYFLDRNNAGLPDGNYVKVTISDSQSMSGAIDFEVEVLSSVFLKKVRTSEWINFFSTLIVYLMSKPKI